MSATQPAETVSYKWTDYQAHVRDLLEESDNDVVVLRIGYGGGKSRCAAQWVHRGAMKDREGAGESPLEYEEDEDYTEIIESNLPDEKNFEIVMEFLSYLFPRVSNETNGIRRYKESRDTYRSRLRICHSDVFPFYFRGAVPKGELSSKEIDSIISAAASSEKFAEKLIELSAEEGRRGRSKANKLLKILPEYQNQVPDGCNKSIIKGILRVGDELVSIDPSQSILDSGTRNHIRSILLDLLEGIDETDRFNVIKEGIVESRSPYVSSDILMVLLREHGENDTDAIEPDQRLLKYSKLEELKSTVVETIEDAAQSGYLSESPNLDVVLARWREWAENEDVVYEWVEDNTQTGDELIYMISQFMRTSRRTSATETQVSVNLNHEWLESLLDISEVEQRFESIKEENAESEEWKEYTIGVFDEETLPLNKMSDPTSPKTWAFVNE